MGPIANYDQRVLLDYRYGQLSGSVNPYATTLVSNEFKTLPSDLTLTRYIPITLADDAEKLSEVAWIVAHSAGSETVTVVRGREGSTARDWATGALWRLAATSRDLVVPYANRAAMPVDGHLGQRGVVLADSVAGAPVPGPVVKTPAGWVDQAPCDGRLHVWKQTASSGTNCPAAQSIILINLQPVAGYQPGIATYPAAGGSGNLLLNRAGLWTVRLNATADATFEGYSTISLNWTGGAFGFADVLLDKRLRSSGYAGAGGVSQDLAWTGWVNSTEASQPIKAAIAQNNPGGSAILYSTLILTAELLIGA